MSPDDIAYLIEACKNGGVTRLKFEKLELQFQVGDPPRLAAAMAKPPAKSIESIIEEDPDLQALYLENLAVEDPLAFEQLRKDRM
ncbi:MAG TPA: hypothetical protein VE954_43405 [Oligoflexus sp.]|uniref:hypothetical protein n=1 Tax=Oligoflexus sp. TaxID=1971216 RepID=UPI002D25FB96|nr:hypothetical protein [Oligoflexus sp.]HYX39993.1 hypothetical protein [Oligoflexus sp.]